MNTLYKLTFLSITSLIIVGCNPKFKEPDADKGAIDASNYVAIGSAMTAGYANGALSYDAQKNSYAALLAEQLKLIGGGEFKIPYVSQSSIGIGNNDGAPSILGNRTDCQGTVSLGPVKVATQGDVSALTNIYSSQGSFNNMGVPNVKVIDMDVIGYSNAFYQRISSDASTSSILSDAVAKNPTFFSVNLGLNDALNFALKGGTADNITPISGPVGIGFEASINNVINKLTANGAKGVIANIPSIKSMAYFNTIAWNALKLTKDKAEFLNANIPSLSFHEGDNGFMIEDTATYTDFRQMVEGEFVLLNIPLDSVKCYTNWGSANLIPDRYTLIAREIDAIENAINNYNEILKNIANAKGLAFVDVNSFFKKVKTGYTYNGVSVNAGFVTGGFYSLDGLNLTPRGNALLTNEFIKAINSTYNSSLPQVDAMKYPAVVFP